MAKLVGTAGHVDHGKTTLIHALTGIDADRLPEEKKRGMTIDIGFAYMDLPEVGRVSIVDVPGHQKFLTNMLVGALSIDVALLCVAADEGVKPQTREHLAILELLPVDRMVVALTRSDLVDAETLELAVLDVQELLETTRFKDSPIMPVSAIQGTGLDELKQELSRSLKGAASSDGGPWYLPIDRAFAVKGHGVVVTGTLAQGKVAVGDRAYIEPGHVEVRVRGIHSHGDTLEASEKGKRTALNLGGIKLEDVERGLAIGEPGSLFETKMLDAKVNFVGDVKHGMRVRVSVGAEEAIGKIFLSETEPSVAQLRLETPVACALNQPLIIRRYSPPDLLAGGRVLVPQAKARRRKEEVQLIAPQAGDEDAILQAVGDSPNGLMTEEICRLLGKTPQALGDVFEKLQKDEKLKGFAGLWMSGSGFEAGKSRFLTALKSLHEANPSQGAIPREKVIEQAKLRWAGKPLDRLLGHVSSLGLIQVQGTLIRDSEFKVQLSPRQRALLDRVKVELDKAGVNAPFASDVARVINVPSQAVEEILKLGMEAKEVTRVIEGIYYTPEQLEKIKGEVRKLGVKGAFSAAEFRDHLGTSRKYAIPLLEYLDTVRFTLRVGDNRVVREES